MTPGLSRNTQAILLLTAPLKAGRETSSPDLLSPGEYKRIARHLRELKCQPADLLSSDATDLVRACKSIVEENRLQHLLGRGFLLSQVVERWQSRAIWVVSRADAEYPGRLKARLREDSPPVIYGCGDTSLAETGGLAVVGSRHVDNELADYTLAIGRLAASARRTIVSGGAKGIDRAAMQGAIEGGGRVTGVLADSLESTAMNRENRNLLVDGQLVLLSPYDPNAGFNVGHAMQRNKLIYALADAALVVSTDINKGGTWAGATEQLEKLRLVPLYVRSTGPTSAGLDALRRKGAASWPNPSDANDFEGVFKLEMAASQRETQVDIGLFAYDIASDPPSRAGRVSSKRLGFLEIENAPTFSRVTGPEPKPSARKLKEGRKRLTDSADMPSKRRVASSNANVAADLFAFVREMIRQLSRNPTKEAEVAAALEVSPSQARVWLRRLVDEGVLEKLSRPVRYVSKANSELFPLVDNDRPR